MGRYDAAYGWTGAGKGLEGLVEGMKLGMSQQNRAGEQWQDAYKTMGSKIGQRELMELKLEGEADKQAAALENLERKGELQQDYMEKLIELAGMKKDAIRGPAQDDLDRDIQSVIKSNPIMGIISPQFIASSRKRGSVATIDQVAEDYPQLKEKYPKLFGIQQEAPQGNSIIDMITKLATRATQPQQSAPQPQSSTGAMEPGADTTEMVKSPEPAMSSLRAKYLKKGKPQSGIPTITPANQ